MKSFLKATAVILTTSLIFISIACQPQPESSMHMDSDEQYRKTVPLIYHMSFMQRYSTKLYLAGIEENWELADIYAHEIEEITEILINGNHMDDGVNISGLLQTMLSPQLEQIGSAIDAGDKEMFEDNYQTMIQTCNQCHQAANYGSVKITIPENNPFNQDFSAPGNQ